MQNNPYEAPKAPIQRAPSDVLRVEDIASGQKLVIYAILVDLASMVLRLVVGPIAGLAALFALAMSIMGIVRLGSGLAMSLVSKVVLVAAMFIPLVNLITLLIVNSRATRHLRNAGYKVGLLGASK